MSYLRALLPVLLVGAFFFAPYSVSAQVDANFFGPIIQGGCYCDAANNKGVQSAPDWGCVLDAVHNTFNLIFSLAILAFLFAAVYAGLMFMTSGAKAEQRTKAKSMLLNIVMGIALALSAWLLVDFIMRAVYSEENTGWGPWYRIINVNSGNRCLQPPPEQTQQQQGQQSQVSVGSVLACDREGNGTYTVGTVQGYHTVDNSTSGVADEWYMDFGDGVAQGVPASRCRAATPGEIAAAAAGGGGGETEEEEGVGDGFDVGDIIECNWENKGTYYEALVMERTNDNLKVTYTSDNIVEQTTKAMCLVPEEEQQEEGPEPTVTVGANAVVSQNAINILKQILREAGLSSATITSGRRTATDQARIMYQNLEQYGVAHQKNLYGSVGDQVIDVYAEQKQAGRSESQIPSAMQQKIEQLGCSSVSRHCSTRDVFDVAPSSISNDAAFRAAVQNSNAVTHYIFPPSDPAYHIEL